MPSPDSTLTITRPDDWHLHLRDGPELASVLPYTVRAFARAVVMPNLNGFQATRQISKDPATSHIPVILVTTKDQETDKVWGMRQGAKAYVTKPVNEAQLVQTIKEIIGG